MARITTFKGHLPGSEPDVKISSPFRVFLLHSQILRLYSPWFAASMSEVWWKAGTPTSGYQYCYDLDRDDDKVSTLIPRKQDAGPTGVAHSKRDPSRTEGLEGLCITYENMFKTFYRLQTPLGSVDEWIGLVSLADQFEALDFVRGSIRSDIFDMDDLGEQIKQSPVKFIILGYHLQSYQIFKESLIHIIGMQCGNPDGGFFWDSSELEIPAPVAKVIISEYYRVEHLMSKAMRELLRLNSSRFPNLSSNYNTHISSIIRCFSSYGAHGNEGTLFKELKLLPLDHSQMATVVKGLALPLTENNLRFNVEVPYLACAQILESQLPWKQT